MPCNRAPASSNGARPHCLARWLLDARQARHLRVGSKILRVKSMPGGQLAASGVRAIMVLQLSSGLLGYVILTRTLRRHKAILIGAVGVATRVIDLYHPRLPDAAVNTDSAVRAVAAVLAVTLRDVQDRYGAAVCWT